MKGSHLISVIGSYYLVESHILEVSLPEFRSLMYDGWQKSASQGHSKKINVRAISDTFDNQISVFLKLPGHSSSKVSAAKAA